MPSTALFLLPAVIPLCYVLYRRFGAYFPVSCIACYGLFSLVFNYDVLTVVYFCFLMFAVCGLILSSQLKPFMLCAAIALISAIAGALVGAGIVRLTAGDMSVVAENYVRTERDDPFISFLADSEYRSAELPEDIVKLEKTDAGYMDAAVEYLAALAEENADSLVPYYCVHFAGILAALGYFFAVALNRKTMSPLDADAAADGLRASTRCLGGAVRETTKFAQMRLPRAYLWAVLLPAFLCALVLDVFVKLDMLAACIMHAFITLPTGFAFLTLLAYFRSLFKSKRVVIVASIILGLFAAAMFLVPTVLLFCSIVGLCDIILNLRFWTEFLMKE